MNNTDNVNKEEYNSNFFNRQKKKVRKPLNHMNRPLTTQAYQGVVGLEFEMEAANNLPSTGTVSKVIGSSSGSFWIGKEDGSLRGYSMEYVLSQPCHPDEVPFLINGLFDVLNTTGVQLNNSNRCSTHVHINMSGKKLGEITSNIILWNVFEKFLIKWNGVERVTNHFALSSEDSLDTVEAWSSFLRNGHMPTGTGIKYSALNVLTLFNLGSLEFRVGAAADEPTKPIRWTNLLISLTNYVEENYKNPRDIARDISERGAYDILNAFAPDFAKEFATTWEEREVFDYECVKSFRRVQHLALEFPWEQWREEEEKTFIPDPFNPTQMNNPTGHGRGRLRHLGREL